jgi:hypothetical protein
VRDRDPEGLDRLAREVPAREVGDRDRGHHRAAEAASLEGPLDREEGGLRVEGVEGGLHEQEIGPAVEEAQGLLVVGLLELGERHPSGSGVVHVARQRRRLVRRPERAGHPRDAALLLRHDPVDRLAGRPRRRDVDFVRERLGAVIRLRDARGVERVRLDDVGPGRQVLPVRGLDHVGATQVQQLVVALDLARPVVEALAAILLLREPVRLQQRPHRPVDDEDPALQLTQQRVIPRAEIGDHGRPV